MDVRALCLAVLSKGDATGYEIKKAFEEGPFSHFQTASFGAIYPSLAKLTKEGMVTVSEQAQNGKPDKKIYRLTAAGTRSLLATLEIEPGPDQIRSDLLFLLFFAEHLPPQRIRTLIDTRITYYREKLTCMLDFKPHSSGRGGGSFVRGFGHAVYQAAADYLEANRDRLVTDVRQQIKEAAD